MVSIAGLLYGRRAKESWLLLWFTIEYVPKKIIRIPGKN